MKKSNRALIGFLVVVISVLFVIINSNVNAALTENIAVRRGDIHFINKPGVATDGFLFRESFEKRNFRKDWFRADMAATSYSGTCSDSVASDGKYSLRLQLNRYDPLVQGSRRAELVSYLEKSSNIERWYGFDIFLPATYKVDSIPEILAQWHVQTTAAQKSEHISPAVSLRVEYDKWRLWIIHDIPPADNTDKYYGSKRFTLPKLEFNKWTKWIFHIKYSHGNDGIVQVWENGVLLVDYKGPDFYDTGMGPYFKIGIYKPAWKPNGWLSPVTQRVVFYDNIKIGDQGMSLAKMTGN